MNTSLTWLGGGNNLATNPKDWTPNQVPASGDTLTMNSGTINVKGAALAGDDLYLFGTSEVVNFNNATLDLVGDFGGVTLNLTGNNSFNVGGAMNFDTIVINMAKNAALTGYVASNFQPGGDPVIINGGTFFNNLSQVSEAPFMTFNCKVEGTGTLVAEGLTFMGAVGAGQTIDTSGVLAIDDPLDFKAVIGGAAQGPGGTPHVPIQPSGNFIGEIDLAGLFQSTSYTFKNDILTLFEANKVVDSLRLNASSVSVDRTSLGISIYAGGDTPASPMTALRVHT